MILEKRNVFTLKIEQNEVDALVVILKAGIEAYPQKFEPKPTIKDDSFLRRANDIHKQLQKESDF